jgi:hypothetical protein
MSTIEEQYNSMIYRLPTLKEGSNIYPKDFTMDYSLFESLIKAMERDGFLNQGYWIIPDGYIFMGLTFKGRSFVQNNDKKQYEKIEKTEINHHYNVNIGRDNNGQIAFGNNNNFASEFDKKFVDLINSIQQSNLNDRDMIVKHLHNVKSDKVELQSYLGNLLTRGAEVSSIIGTITSLLPFLAN